MTSKTLSNPYEIYFQGIYNLIARELGKPEVPFEITGDLWYRVPFSRFLQSFINLKVVPNPPYTAVKPVELDDRTLLETVKRVIDYQPISDTLDTDGVNHFDIHDLPTFCGLDSSYKSKFWEHSIIIFLIKKIYFEIGIENLQNHVKLDDETRVKTLRLSPLLAYYSFSGYLPVELGLSDDEVSELNSQLFIQASILAGYYQEKLISAESKREEMVSLGLEVGSMVFLYKRRKTRNSKTDIVDSCKIAKITEVGQRSVSFETYNISKSYAEGVVEYYQADERIKDLYPTVEDYCSYKPLTNTMEIGWDSLGVGYLLNNDPNFSEQYFIGRLESIHSATVLFMGEDYSLEELTANTHACTYYLLKERGIDFDEDLFKKMYQFGHYDELDEIVFQSNIALEEKYDYQI